MRFWQKAANEPWAITETALQTILGIAAREQSDPQYIGARMGDAQRQGHVTQVHGDVAVIPVVGPLFRYANLFTAISGASSYELLKKDFYNALESTDIAAIILDIDSPGGEVNGVAEFAQMIYNARGSKPIIAYASGDAASGAYWLAAAADQVIASPTSALGSIGVVGVFYGKDKDNKEIEIVSSQSPHKRLDPASEKGFERLQGRINSMAAVFVDSVAQYRGVSADVVQTQFGAGDVLIGAAAVNAGLADRIASLDDILTEFAEPSAKQPPTAGGFLMQPTHPQQEEIATMDRATLEQEHPALVAELLADGRASERSRIEEIMQSDGASKCREMALELAFSTDLPAAQAVTVLNSAPEPTEPKTTSFEQHMAGVPNPDIPSAGDDESTDDVATLAKSIANAV